MTKNFDKQAKNYDKSTAYPPNPYITWFGIIFSSFTYNFQAFGTLSDSINTRNAAVKLKNIAKRK